MKIVIGINSLTSTSQLAYSNHIQNFFRLGKWAEYGGHEICLVNPPRMSIDRMRNYAGQVTLDIQADYLIFIDDDVLLPVGFLPKLLKCMDEGYHMACGDVLVRGYPFNHMVFRGSVEKGLNLLEELPDEDGDIIPVDACGFSLCIIKREVLERTPTPWFITGLYNTEDVYFCIKAKKYIPELKIVLDKSIVCGHILGLEFINVDNKKAYKSYVETMEPHLLNKKSKDGGDRGIEYLNAIKGVISHAVTANET